MKETRTAVQEIFTLWQSLNDQARKQVNALLGRKASIESNDRTGTREDSDIELLWWSMVKQSLLIRGVPLPERYTYLRAPLAKEVEGYLRTAVMWLTSTQYPIDRATKIALFNLAAEALLLTHVSAKNELSAQARLTKYIPIAVETCYPGYQRNDALLPIVRKLMQGKIVKESNDARY